METAQGRGRFGFTLPGMSPGVRSSTFCASGALIRNVMRPSVRTSGDTICGVCEPPRPWAVADDALRMAITIVTTTRFISTSGRMLFGDLLIFCRVLACLIDHENGQRMLLLFQF